MLCWTPELGSAASPGVSTTTAVPSGVVTTNFTITNVNLVVTNVVITNLNEVFATIVTTNASETKGQKQTLDSVFWFETYKVVLDKGFLAILLLAAGWWINRQVERFKSQLNKDLERFKSQVAFTEELNKTRLQQIAEVWGALHHYRDVGLEIVAYWTEHEDKKQSIFLAEMGNMLGLARKEREHVADLINNNVFWLGRKQTTRATQFLCKIDAGLKCIENEKPAPADFEKELQGLSAVIHEIHKQISKGELDDADS
jgi:hypothetical protein